MSRYHKEVREVIQYAESRGWIDQGPSNGGHIKLYHPSGGVVILAATPSNRRFKDNSMTDIHREERRCQP